MSPLSPDARAILRAARGGDEMSSATKARLRASLGARLAATAASASVAPATKALAWSSLSARVGAAMFAVALGGAIAWLARPAPAPSATLSPAPVVALVDAASSGATTTAPSAATAPLAVEEAVAPTSTEPPKSLKPAAPRASIASKPTATPGPSLEEELAALRLAQSALRDKDAARAREILETFDRTHPGGVLATEREGAALVARCASDRGAQATAAAERFAAQNPSSPLAPRVRAACAPKTDASPHEKERITESPPSGDSSSTGITP